MDTFNNKGLAPGKKALVIGSVRCPGAIGKVVELIKFLPKGTYYILSGNLLVADRAGWKVEIEILYKGVFYSEWAFLPEHLMPLDDDEGMCDNSSEEQTREKENAH